MAGVGAIFACGLAGVPPRFVTAFDLGPKTASEPDLLGQVQAVLLGQGLRDLRAGGVPATDENLAEETTGVGLLRECRIELFRGQDAALHQDEPKRTEVGCLRSHPGLYRHRLRENECSSRAGRHT